VTVTYRDVLPAHIQVLINRAADGRESNTRPDAHKSDALNTTRPFFACA